MFTLHFVFSNETENEVPFSSVEAAVEQLLAEGVASVYVGRNPKVGRQAIAAWRASSRPNPMVGYLEEIKRRADPAQ